MNRWAAERLRELAGEDLSGYVLKKDSPSCGMERVKTYGDNGPAARDGRGIFAAALLERFPQLPVEEEGRLGDPTLRENFIERVFAYRRLQDLFSGRWRAGDLVRFHTAHKMALLAHSTTAYKQLGQLVAGAGSARSAGLQGCQTKNELRDAYRSLFMQTLAIRATRARHTNVLQHMAGHLKTLLSAEARADLAQTITEYHAGLVPLVVPVTLIRHYVRLHDVAYLKGQVYLEPHPREMMLRNHV
jgi:uncharacterized protein YbgA (DUF1722 family)